MMGARARCPVALVESGRGRDGPVPRPAGMHSLHWAAAAFRLALALLVWRQRCSPSRASDFYVLYHLGTTDRDMRDAAGTAARPILSDISRKSPPQPQALRVCPPLSSSLGNLDERAEGEEMNWMRKSTRGKREIRITSVWRFSSEE